MKVKFVYPRNVEETYLPIHFPYGQVNLRENLIVINASLSTYQKIRTLAHELCHYLVYKLFWRMQGTHLDMRWYLDNLLDYKSFFWIQDFLESCMYGLKSKIAMRRR